MLSISHWRLRTLLYALMAAVIMPSAGLILYNAYTQYRNAEEVAAKQAYNLAQITADNTQGFLRDAQQLLSTLAVRIEKRSAAGPACDPIFAEFKDLYPQFANLSQANNAGYLVCSTTEQPGNVRTYVGNMQWFTDVQAKKRFTIAAPYTGVVTKRLVSVLAQPILDRNGVMRGSLQLPIDLAKFRLIPGMDKLPRSITVSLINSSGILVARSQDADQFVGNDLSSTEAVKNLLRIKNGTVKSYSSKGVQRIYGFVPVAGTDWYASAGISTDEVLHEARSNAIHNLMIGAVLLLLVLILALYLSNRISKPILQIQATAVRVASGAYEARALVMGPAEVAQVAEQFNAMLQAIENNIRERSVREQEIHRYAFYDALTELPNRRLLMQSIDQSIETARRDNQTGAIFYVDLDRFKEVNDSFGHAIGDRFLVHVSERLGAVVADGKALARIAGDEFVLVVNNLGNSQQQAFEAAMTIGRRISFALNEPFLIDHQVIDSSGSVGVTLFPKVGDSGDGLLQEADLAMYKAKSDGRNRVRFFESALRVEINERRALKADLKQALETGALQLHIQPQFNCSGETVGAELLLRWTDPVRGSVSPAVFIPIAEESDLIVSLGKWVLDEGCRILARVHGIGHRFPLSINVSPRQFRHPDFVEQVRTALDTAGAPPAFLILEVTEGLLIEELATTVGRMHTLAEMGIRFSIDDFGTGYSNMKYLKELPLYELKIDRSFVNDIPDSPKATAIVQSILDMARHLELNVVAEGVETRAQANFLTSHACDAMQGFLFARPTPVKDFLQRKPKLVL